MNYYVGMILFILAGGVFLATLRYILGEKSEKNISSGQLLVDILKVNGYRKVNMPNEYPKYKGGLEEKDTQEYMEFISSDILDLIK